jgi:uncharacterized protein (DUF1697 family)
MHIYIAFLRGINVGGHNKIKMADLKNKLSKLKYQDLATYIQSGNILFKSDKGDIGEIEDEIKNLIYQEFGFDVPVLVKTSDEVQSILDANPFANTEHQKNLYFALLKGLPLQTHIQQFKQLEYENEEFIVKRQCVYLNCHLGAGKAKLTNSVIEKKLKVEATTRNLNTIKKMVAMANNK